MENKELLLAISDMMDQKLEVINVRMNTMENRLEARINSLDAKIISLDTRIDFLDAKIDTVDERLGSQIRQVNITLENVVIPRLNHIEQCYLATSERYINETGRVDGLVADMQVIKSIVQEHSEKLQKIS